MKHTLKIEPETGLVTLSDGGRMGGYSITLEVALALCDLLPPRREEMRQLLAAKLRVQIQRQQYALKDLEARLAAVTATNTEI